MTTIWLTGPETSAAAFGVFPPYRYSENTMRTKRLFALIDEPTQARYTDKRVILCEFVTGKPVPKRVWEILAESDATQFSSIYCGKLAFEVNGQTRRITFAIQNTEENRRRINRNLQFNILTNRLHRKDLEKYIPFFAYPWNSMNYTFCRIMSLALPVMEEIYAFPFYSTQFSRFRPAYTQDAPVPSIDEDGGALTLRDIQKNEHSTAWECTDDEDREKFPGENPRLLAYCPPEHRKTPQSCQYVDIRYAFEAVHPKDYPVGETEESMQTPPSDLKPQRAGTYVPYSERERKRNWCISFKNDKEHRMFEKNALREMEDDYESWDEEKQFPKKTMKRKLCVDASFEYEQMLAKVYKEATSSEEESENSEF